MLADVETPDSTIEGILKGGGERKGYLWFFRLGVGVRLTTCNGSALPLTADMSAEITRLHLQTGFIVHYQRSEVCSGATSFLLLMQCHD
jgi:hypothetical protein